MALKTLLKLSLQECFPVPGKPVKLDWLPLADLRVDDGYQRVVTGAGEAHVRRIAKRFEWRKFAPVIVSVTGRGDGTYAIIDGQHRSMAALALGYDRVPCAIVEASHAEAAAIFAAVNGDTLRMGAASVFKAALAAGVEWAVVVERCCAAVGVIPLTYPLQAQNQKPMMTNAVGRFRRCFKAHGEAFLAAVLQLIVAEPHVQVPGFINSKMIDDKRNLLLAERNGKIDPAAAAQRLIASTRRQAPLALPSAALVGVAQVKPVNMAEADALARVQDLKARNFTKSMVAASLKLRYATVEQLWEKTA